jgi:Tfp pilus assembly protein PilE
MLRKMNSKGFAVIEAILIVVIVGLLAGVGYYIWHTNQQTKATLDAAAKVAQSSPQKVTKKSTGSSTKPATDTAFLTFSEWGVKIPLSSSISDAYYVYKNGYVYLSVNSLSNTDCSADSTTLGAVMRFTADQKDDYSGELYVNEIKDAKKIGQYYYSYTHPQAGCSDDQTVLAKADADMAAFKTAVSNIQQQ